MCGVPTTAWLSVLPHLLTPALLLALLLAACAPTGPSACQPKPLEVANTGDRPLEQLYYGAPGAWGEDLLGGAEVAAGEARPVVMPGVGGLALRAVWADGRAIELRGLDPCRNARIVLTDRGVRAE